MSGKATARRSACFVLLLVLAGCGVRHVPQTGTAPVPAWRWSAPPPAEVGMPAVAGRDVAVTFGHAGVTLVGTDGRERWRADRLGVRDVAPAFTDALVLAATDDGVAAFARAGGALRWDTTLGDRASTPVVAGATVVVTLWNGALAAVDVGVGAVRWRLRLPGLAIGPPAVYGTTAVATWEDEHGGRAGLIAADTGTGRVRWRAELAPGGVSAPAIGRGVAVVVAGDRRAHAFDLRGGRERWRTPLGGAGSPEVAPLVVAGGFAVADRVGDLAVLRAADGRARDRVAGVGDAVRGGPVAMPAGLALPVDDGRVLLAAGRGTRVLDPPGRVSGVATAGRLLLAATREADHNSLVAYRW
jgi:outer membrane protein assembly factor BamB